MNCHVFRECVKRTAQISGTALVMLMGAAHGTMAAEGPVKIGVMTDLTSTYADISGKGSVEAVKLAIEDFGGSVLGKPVELVIADHQNKVDIGATIARRWYDQDGVDAISDVTGSAIALAVQQLAAEKNKVSLISGSASTELSGKSCSPNGFQWAADSYALVHALGGMVDVGGTSWYLVSQDAAIGKSYERDVAELLKDRNVPLLGIARFPIGNSDFSSQLITAQSSQAKVIALSSGGGDTLNLLKQAHEFGIEDSGQAIVPISVFPTDILAIGLSTAQGVRYATTFYWDLNDATRSFQERFIARVGHPPTWIQAGNYSAITHYLKAIQAAGTKDAGAVIAAMRHLPIEDATTPHATLREDGRVIRDVYVVEVRGQKEAPTQANFERLVSTIAGEKSFRPLSQSECPLVKK